MDGGIYISQLLYVLESAEAARDVLVISFKSINEKFWCLFVF